MHNPFKTAAPVLAAAVFLFACTEPTGDRLLDENGRPLGGDEAFADGLDGLTVGDRLMAAREFELALRAYTLVAAEIGFTPEVLSAIGTANLGLGRLGQAETLLREAVKKDEKSVPAWNNLGVVLNARQKFGEAREAFRVAFALDDGSSPEIRQNLRLLDAKLENIAPPQPVEEDFRLVRRGNGRYLLIGN